MLDPVADAFAQLVRAKRDRKSRLREMHLATIAPDRGPAVRTVVLRDVDADAWSVEFWTDARSTKMAEIAADANVAVNFWDGRRLQFRGRGRAVVASSGDPRLAELLSSLPEHALRDYATRTAPGTSGAGGHVEDVRDAARINMRRVTIELTDIDILHLDREGHRRWCFTRDGGGAVTP